MSSSDASKWMSYHVTTHAVARYRERFAEDYDLPREVCISRMRFIAENAVPYGGQYNGTLLLGDASGTEIVLVSMPREGWRGSIITALTRDQADASMSAAMGATFLAPAAKKKPIETTSEFVRPPLMNEHPTSSPNDDIELQSLLTVTDGAISERIAQLEEDRLWLINKGPSSQAFIRRLRLVKLALRRLHEERVKLSGERLFAVSRDDLPAIITLLSKTLAGVLVDIDVSKLTPEIQALLNFTQTIVREHDIDDNAIKRDRIREEFGLPAQ